MLLQLVTVSALMFNTSCFYNLSLMCYRHMLGSCLSDQSLVICLADLESRFEHIRSVLSLVHQRQSKQNEASIGSPLPRTFNVYQYPQCCQHETTSRSCRGRAEHLIGGEPCLSWDYACGPGALWWLHVLGRSRLLDPCRPSPNLCVLSVHISRVRRILTVVEVGGNEYRQY